MDAAEITAVLTGIAGVIAAIGVVVKIVLSRPRLPVAEELLEQIDELRGDVLALARWAHRAVAHAASQGFELDEPPAVLRSSGEREGERQHSPMRHGWRSGVVAQTGNDDPRAFGLGATGPHPHPPPPERRRRRMQLDEE